MPDNDNSCQQPGPMTASGGEQTSAPSAQSRRTVRLVGRTTSIRLARTRGYICLSGVTGPNGNLDELQ